jgi:hypothetical protein
MIKKTLLTILIASLILISTQSISAFDNEDSYDEEIYLVNSNYDESDFLFNGSPAKWSDMELTEGNYDQVTFLLSDALVQIEPQDGFEVQSITLKIGFSMTQTSENITILTNDDELQKQENTYDSYTATVFSLNIDVEDYLNINEHTSNFSYSGTSTSPIKVGSSFINVVYIKSEGSYNDSLECGTDYSMLPNTNEQFLDIISIEEYNVSTHSYKMSFSLNEKVYYFNVSIPHEIYDHVYSSRWDEKIYFRDIKANQMSLGSSPSGDQILYIQPDNIKSNKPALLDNGDEPDIVGFATINLTKMEYQVVNKLQLMGVVNKEDSRYASLYCFFPTRIENLLSITISYEYRINKILGIKGEWQDTMNTYVRGDQYDGAPPSWQWWIPGFGWGWASASYITGDYDIYNIPDIITSIEASDVPGEVEYKYINELGGSKSDLNSLELYKVNLGQFQDGFFTAFSDENAYDIQDVVILEVLYEYKGVVYEASTEEISSIISTPTLSPGLINIEDKTTQAIIYGLAGLAAFFILVKLDLKKNPGLAVIIIAAAFYILYKMGLL